MENKCNIVHTEVLFVIIHDSKSLEQRNVSKLCCDKILNHSQMSLQNKQFHLSWLPILNVNRVFYALGVAHKNESGGRISGCISAGKDLIYLCFRIPRLEIILASWSLSIFHNSPTFVMDNGQKPFSENIYYCRRRKRRGEIQFQSQNGFDKVRAMNLNVCFLSRREIKHLNEVLRVFLQRDPRIIFIKL